MSNYTTQWFWDKLSESALSLYKDHWHVHGRRESKQIKRWLKDERERLADQDWIHDLGDEYEETLYTAFGDNYDKEFCEFIQIEIDRYIDNGELEEYIYTKMKDYATDLAREL